MEPVRSPGPGTRTLTLAVAVLLVGVAGVAFLDQHSEAGPRASLVPAASVIGSPTGSVAPSGAPRSPRVIAQGQPENAVLLAAAFDRLRELTSYRTHLEGVGKVETPRVDQVVINRPIPAVERHTEAAGRRFSSVIIGTRTWTRSNGQAYTRVNDPNRGPLCGRSSTAIGPCTFESMTYLAGPSGGLEDTFVRVGNVEVIDGLAAMHLHSDSGTEVADYGRVPGIVDIWISIDRGVLLRRIFVGHGYTETLEITNIDDASNTVQRPRRRSSLPAASSPLPTTRS